MEFWNSAETLGRINTYLQVALVIFGILTGVLGAASFVIGHRKDALDDRSKVAIKEHVENITGRTSDIRALVGRALLEADSQKLKSVLDGTSPMKVMAIRHNSKESQRYSLQIEKVLESVGWKVEQLLPGSLRIVSPPAVGVNEQNPDLREFKVLRAAFESLGLPFKFDEFRGNMDHQIILDVGVIPANEYQAVIDKVQ